MFKNIKGLGKLFWAAGAALCLLALVVGLIYASVNSYPGETERPSVELGAAGSREKHDKADKKASKPSGGPVSGELNTLPKSKAAGDEYISSLTFLCDSVHAPLISYGADSSKVWLGEDGVLPDGILNTARIIFPSDGSAVTAANAAMISKPAVLVVLVGSDGLSATDELAFKNALSGLLDGIMISSPETQVICCSIPYFTAACLPLDGVTSVMIERANGWLKDVCTERAVWYADTAAELCTESCLKDEYAQADGRTLNGAGVSVITEWLSKHALS